MEGSRCRHSLFLHLPFHHVFLKGNLRVISKGAVHGKLLDEPLPFSLNELKSYSKFKTLVYFAIPKWESNKWRGVKNDYLGIFFSLFSSHICKAKTRGHTQLHRITLVFLAFLFYFILVDLHTFKIQ